MDNNTKYQTLYALLNSEETKVLLQKLSHRDFDTERKRYVERLMEWATLEYDEFTKKYTDLLCGAPDDVSSFGHQIYFWKFMRPVEIAEYIISGLSYDEQREIKE